MSTCSFQDCGKPSHCKGFCSAHYQKNRLYGTPNGRPVVNQGFVDDHGYRMLSVEGQKIREHVQVAEKALGRKMPKGLVVHHVNENKLDNTPSNLVICQDEAYHQLIHRRTRAYDACGNADARQCMYCKQWATPPDIYINDANSSAMHRACVNEYKRRIYAQKKESQK